MRLVRNARWGLIAWLGIGLFSSAASAAPAKLNGILPLGGNVDPAFHFSPDSSHILYVADQDTDQIFELYSVSSVGGATLKLSGSMVNGGDVMPESVRVSPNGSRVAYVADQDADEVPELYSVASGGGPTVKLNGPLPLNGAVEAGSQQFSPNSSLIAYQADQQTDQVFELYGVPAAGGASTKLNGVLANGGDVDSAGLLFSPDSSRVLYVADQDTDQVFELYSAAANGSGSIRLSGPMVSGGSIASGTPRFSANGTRILYIANQDTTSRVELYSVAASGGVPVKLNATLVSGGNILSASPRFSPDSNRAIYVADQDTNNKFELYSVASAGGTPVKINGSLVLNGDVVETSARISPDSTHVLYIGDEDADERFELYNVPIGGGTPIKLNGAFSSAQGDVKIAEFTPDGSRVIYLANEDSSSAFELFSVSSSGGTPTKLSGPLVVGGDVTYFEISPNSQLVVYRADANTDNVFELYSVSVSGAAVPGDYNHNGIVDAADYTVWRDTLGSTIDLRADGDTAGASAGKIDQADYTFWKNHFTQSGSGAGANITVPEPASACLIYWIAVMFRWRRRSTAGARSTFDQSSQS